VQLNDFISAANLFGRKRVPFFFLLDFEMEYPFICELKDVASQGFLIDIRGRINISPDTEDNNSNYNLKSLPIRKDKYSESFKLVKKNILEGNTYLLNLTFPAVLETDITLRHIFHKSREAYKLCHPDKFVLFSPECFVKTSDDYIYSYPMKGTIDASIPDAERLILQDEKETWEHNTIVDLIRNDLAMVSHNITVTKFRYIDHLKTDRNELLQVSSEIRGELDHYWRSQIGTIIVKMLPAGSICGAPKNKTVEIIKAAEKQKRGYYTGIFGIFDGKYLDSAVNIRFIEKAGSRLQYRSGGGITAMSDVDKEYQELLDKIYVPID
jgi:para-aminobenzoate synthetase component 1